MTIRTVAERLWRGEITTHELSPMTTFLGLEAYADDVAFVSSFANVTAFATAEGLVLVDTGSELAAPAIRAQLRAWRRDGVHTIVLTHGHVDHVMGTKGFDDEAIAARQARPRVIAHEAIRDRFERYRLTAGYNGAINARQFRMPGLRWPTEYRDPDVVLRDRLEVVVGGEHFELHHDRGETDDHVWLWWPARRVLCTGDLFIWASPNCGNPQKVQRYPREWARALRKMAALAPAVLFPGHGPPIEGEARVALALGDTAALLESLVEQVLAALNGGANLDEVLASVRAPAELLARPYLRPVYDDPEFIVRNLVRLYGGWWDGNAAHLKPPREAAVAAEVASLAGGPGPLIERAQAVAAAGDLALACQLAEWAAAAAPADAAVHAARASLYRTRAAAEPSLMARSIFTSAAE